MNAFKKSLRLHQYYESQWKIIVFPFNEIWNFWKLVNYFYFKVFLWSTNCQVIMYSGVKKIALQISWCTDTFLNQEVKIKAIRNNSCLYLVWLHSFISNLLSSVIECFMLYKVSYFYYFQNSLMGFRYFFLDNELRLCFCFILF